MSSRCIYAVTTWLALNLLGLALAADIAAPDPTAREDAARQTASAFIQELGDALQAAMQQDGPAGAVEVCTEIAPKIANRLSRQHGWRVTRVGTRVRNPLLGSPDAWEQQALAAFAARAAKGERFQDMTHSEVVSEPDGRYFRFMRPIGVQPLCLSCHGTAEHLSPAVRAVLTTHYPGDQATGYRVGDLRGAVSIKQPLGGAQSRD